MPHSSHHLTITTTTTAHTCRLSGLVAALNCLLCGPACALRSNEHPGVTLHSIRRGDGDHEDDGEDYRAT